MRLPIEDDEELLKEFGRVNAYINQVDYELGCLIDSRKKVVKSFSKTCQTETLGVKITKEENKPYIPEDLLQKLKSLNKERNRSAVHIGFIGRIKEGKTIKYTSIKDSGKNIEFDTVSKKNFKKIVELSKDILKKIIEEFKNNHLN